MHSAGLVTAAFQGLASLMECSRLQREDERDETRQKQKMNWAKLEMRSRRNLIHHKRWPTDSANLKEPKWVDATMLAEFDELN